MVRVKQSIDRNSTVDIFPEAESIEHMTAGEGEPTCMSTCRAENTGDFILLNAEKP